MIICFLLNLVFKTCVVPGEWRIVTPDPNNSKDFRPIPLLNVEGKLFFSILPKRLEKHVCSNKLINSSIQKGCMERVPGRWEHMSVVCSKNSTSYNIISFLEYNSSIK